MGWLAVYLSLKIDVDFGIKSLFDLPKFKQLMEYMKMKINKSKLQRN